MTHAPALLLALVLQVGAPADTVTEIRGVVVGERGAGSLPLPYAALEVAGPGGSRTVLADDQGRYSIPARPGGRFQIAVQYLGYERAEVVVLVPAGASVPLDLVLDASPVELPPLLVTGERIFLPELEETAQGTEGAGGAEIEMRALEATPGLVESGLGAAAGRVQGNDPSDPTDVLFMRGSTADMKLVLLDGAPVYTPFHLGGVLRSFDAGALSSATHHVGGAPARYDGGLSYILDLRTRTPARDAFRTDGALDLMSARASAEGPLGRRAALLVSTRLLHGLASRLAGGVGSPYGYADGLARGVWGTGAHRLSLTAFGNRESVHLNPDRAAEAADPSSPESLPPGAVPDDASWGNAALSLRYAGDFRKTRVELGAATTRYRAELPFPLARDTSAQAPPPGNGPPDGMLATGETGRLRLTADAQHTLASGELRVGVSLDRLHTDASAWRLSAPESPVGYRADARGRVLGGYLDGIQRVAPGLDLRYGLRLDHFDPGGTKGALRLALLWSLTEEALLGITVGRYHQLSLATDADLNLQMGDGTTAGTGGVPSSAGDPALLSVARSDHLVVSLDQRLTPAVHLGLEGYFKRFGGLPGVQQQELNASGLDLRLLREGDRLTGWLGYSLSWFWENPDALGRTQEFAGRHLLSVGLRSRPFPDWGVDVEAAFSEGLPLTSIPFSRSVSATAASDSEAIPGTASPPPIATDAFLRLDAEVFAELEPRWRGRSLALRPYLRLLNALNRRDALFYYFEPWRDPGLRPLAELSVVPVLGVEWRF